MPSASSSSRIIVFLAASSLLALSPAHADLKSAKALVAKKAAILKAIHSKAGKALVNAAQDDAYATLAVHHDDHQARKRVDKVSLNVQKRFAVEEMCLIHKDGPELSRIVGKAVADDLSPDESGAIFFKAAFDMPPKKVYISPIYMSPDANKLVLAYVTPVVAEGQKQAILHYEHGLDYYQHRLNKSVPANATVLAVNAQGLIVSDSRQPLDINKQGDKEDPADYLPAFRWGDLDIQAVRTAAAQGQPVTDSDGKAWDVAAREVERWTLLAFTPH